VEGHLEGVDDEEKGQASRLFETQRSTAAAERVGHDELEAEKEVQLLRARTFEVAVLSYEGEGSNRREVIPASQQTPWSSVQDIGSGLRDIDRELLRRWEAS
jgi:hypothetical protein